MSQQELEGLLYWKGHQDWDEGLDRGLRVEESFQEISERTEMMMRD